MSEENEEMMTIDEIKEYVHSDDFRSCIEKAKASKVEILSDFKTEMNDVRTEFVDYMVSASGAQEKKDKKSVKRAVAPIYNKVVNYLHSVEGIPNEKSRAKLDVLAEQVAIAVKYLDFAKNTTFRDYLEKYGIYIDDKKSATLADDYPNLKEGSWENFKGMLEDGNACKGKIYTNNQTIEKDVFENEVPEELRFSKENKNGMKKAQFNKIVTAEAMKSIKKDSEKMKKYLDNITENSLFNIVHEELLQEGINDVRED